MAETTSPQSPLMRLVLFMVCLSVAGAVLASVHYVAVDLPHQKNLQAPTNEQGICGVCCQYDLCLSVNNRKTCDAMFPADQLQYCPI